MTKFAHACKNPISSSTAAKLQGHPAPHYKGLAGRAKATSPMGRAPRMQPRLPALLCTAAAFIGLGREPSNPAAVPEEGGLGKKLE